MPGARVVVTVVDRSALVAALVHGIAARNVRKATYIARDSMRDRVPIDSGALKNSIEVIRHGPGEYEIAAGGDEVE